MDRFEQQTEELVELGAASIETKGPPIQNKDTFGGNVLAGISDD